MTWPLGPTTRWPRREPASPPRERCLDALAGLRGAVAALYLAEPALTVSLLVREVGVAVDRAFAVVGAGQPGRGRLGAVTLPCMAVSCCRRNEPFGGPRRRPGRCGDCCTEGCCEGCCEACGDCGDCASCCDCF